MDERADSQSPGKVKQIGGYRLESKLGQGGMGVVFKATETSLDRPVALKVLSPKIAEDERSLQRFLREARSAAKLRHPHIVAAYDVGQSPEGYHYFAMEFVDGESLRARIKRQTALDQREATEIILSVARGLQHAEAVGMVHRDIKPDNILIDQDGTPKSADFGLAKTHEDPTVTQAGGVIGSPHYMSPEQAAGKQDIDIRTDLYSLGVTYYQAIVGKPPFSGETAGVIISKQINDPAPAAHEQNALVSEYTSRVILKMMAKDPAERYQTCGELIEDLEKLLAGQTPAAAARALAARGVTRSRTLQEARRGGKKSSKTAAMIAAGVIGVALLGASVLILTRRPSGPAEATGKSVLGSKGSPGTPGTVKTPTPSDSRERRAASALESADTYAAARPGDLRGQTARYQTVIDDFPRSDAASKAAKAVEAIRTKWDARARQELETLREAADDLLAEKDYGKALAEFLGFPAALLNEQWSQEVEGQKQACRDAAEAEFQALKTEAAGLAAAGKLSVAREALRAALSFGLTRIQKETETAIAELDERIEAAEAEAQGKAELAFKGLLAKLKPLLEARDYPAAVQTVESAETGQSDLPTERARELRSFVAKLADFWSSVETGASRLKKDELFSVKGTSGKVLRYEDGKIFVDVGGPEVGRRLIELKAAELTSLVKRAGDPDSGETHLRLALFLIADREAEPATAREHFDAAAAAGTAVDTYRPLFELFEGDAAEVASKAPDGGTEEEHPEAAGKEKPGKRTKSQALAIIERAGRTRPEWWEAVEMVDYPKTLDLTWPKPSGGWDEKLNVGQYMWGVVNPDPARWKPGVKFMHHVLQLNRKNPEATERAQVSLGQLYTDLLEDYARGAYWYRQRLRQDEMHRYDMLKLATCYWKLGSRELAAEVLLKVEKERDEGSIARLWGDMGATDKALRVAAGICERGRPDEGYRAAGDVHRQAGKYKKALECYQKVLDLQPNDREQRGYEWNKEQARGSLRATEQLLNLDVSKIPDGAYEGKAWVPRERWHLRVKLEVSKGKIVACQVTERPHRYFGSALQVTPRQIVEKNGVQGVDLFTAAPVFTQDVISAVADALANASSQNTTDLREPPQERGKDGVVTARGTVSGKVAGKGRGYIEVTSDSGRTERYIPQWRGGCPEMAAGRTRRSSSRSTPCKSGTVFDCGGVSMTSSAWRV